MGQAKKRGTLKERRQQSITKQKGREKKLIDAYESLSTEKQKEILKEIKSKTKRKKIPFAVLLNYIESFIKTNEVCARCNGTREVIIEKYIYDCPDCSQEK